MERRNGVLWSESDMPVRKLDTDSELRYLGD